MLLSAISLNCVFSFYFFTACWKCCVLQFTNDQGPKDRGSRPVTGAPKNAEELERRRDIAENYLKKLAAAKTHWVDPYDVLDNDKNRYKISHVKRGEVSTISIANKPHLDNDFKPVFSDIKGEVIGSSSIINNAPSVTDQDKVNVKTFSDVKQEICVLDSIYVTRWLKKLVLKIERDATLESSLLSFSFNMDSLENLRRMSTSKSLDIGELDELICSLIGKATITNQKEYDWSYLVDFAFYAAYALSIIFASVSILYFVTQFVKKYPVLTFIGFVVMITVFWHWMHLYKQKLSHKHAELSGFDDESKCIQKDLGLLAQFSQYLKSYFSDNDCKKYYEALMVDPFWEVSIAVAASEAFAAVIFQPLNAGSRAVNLCIRQLYDGLSIFIMIPLTIFLFILMMMLCNYKIKFPFFMGSLEPTFVSSGSGIEDIRLAEKVEHSNLIRWTGASLRKITSTDIPSITLTQGTDVCSSSVNAFYNQTNGDITKSGAYNSKHNIVNLKMRQISGSHCMSNDVHHLAKRYDEVREQGRDISDEFYDAAPEGTVEFWEEGSFVNVNSKRGLNKLCIRNCDCKQKCSVASMTEPTCNEHETIISNCLDCNAKMSYQNLNSNISLDYGGQMSVQELRSITKAQTSSDMSSQVRCDVTEQKEIEGCRKRSVVTGHL